MATPNEIDELITIIKRVWLFHPHLRISQLISNAASLSKWSSNDIFYLSDDQLLDGLKKLEQKLSGKIDDCKM